MHDFVSVGLTSDFLTPEGQLSYRDIGLSVLDAEPRIRYRFMERHPLLLQPEHIRDYDAIVSLAPKYTKETFAGAERLTLIARFGVGYDVVDLAACTAADVALCTARGAVDHSMAEAIIAWMLALSYRVFAKDRLLRDGRWAEKLDYMGSELRGRQLGVIGLGGIGRKLVQKLAAFEMEPPLVCDPFLTTEQGGVALVPLERVLQESDFVAICCPLTPETHHLINRTNIGLMKPGAYLLNAARGGIVEEAALIEALETGRLAGAGIDVFEQQPVGLHHPLAKFDNVILAPHCIGWTHEMFRDIGRLACEAVVQIARGEVPKNVINRDVLQRRGFLRKLARFKTNSAST